MGRFEELHAEWLEKEAEYHAKFEAEFGRTAFQRCYRHSRRMGCGVIGSFFRALMGR